MNLAVQSGKDEIVSFLLSCQSSSGGDNSQILPLLIQAITSGQCRMSRYEIYSFMSYALLAMT